MMQKDKKIDLGILALLLVAVPIMSMTGAIDINNLTLFSRYLCFAIAAIGVDLIWGYTGIMSMCQAFFFCLGAYGVGMYLTINNLPEGAAVPDFMKWNNITELPMFWMPFKTLAGSIVACILVTAAFAALSFFIFRRRIKGVFIAIITQAIALAMFLLFSRNETLLGGSNGLTNFQEILGFDLRSSNVKLALYIITVVMLALSYWVGNNLVKSKFGKVLISINGSESRLRFTGYKVAHYQTAIFVLGALLAMIGGMLYLPQTGIVTPGRMDVRASIEMLIWVALGGRGNLKGAIVGTLIVNLLYSMFTSLMPDAWPYFLGLMYVLTVLYLKNGVMGWLNNTIEIVKNKFFVKKAKA